MKMILQGFHSVCVALLAASFFYLGYALLQTAARVEVIVMTAEGIAEKLGPVVDLAPEFLNESEQLRDTATEVVAEVEAVRSVVPRILQESAAIRQSLPAILEQTELMRKESEQIRAEVALFRETIPPTLNRVEQIVLEADKIASKAGENVFTGMISGIFKAPVKLLGNVTDFLLPSNAQLSESDQTELKKRMQEFLSIAKIGDVQTFVTEKPTISLQFELLSHTLIDSMDCRLVALRSRKANKLLKQTELQICLDEDGNWFLHGAEER